MDVKAAYHEAGHALVAKSLGRAVESVSVAPLGVGGAVNGEPLPSDATPDQIEKALVVAFAGQAAEEYADRAAAPASNGSVGDPYFSLGELSALADSEAARDKPRDREVIAYYRDLIGDEAVQRAHELAVELVWRFASLGRLSLLAGELCARNHLTNTEIDEILEGGNRR
jgi:hypothetical protein